MHRLFLALGSALGGALAMHFVQNRNPAHRTIKKPTGHVTPARAAIHGDLMQRCIDPDTLQRASTLFGQEGLTIHAETLYQKAVMIHEIMSGARSIVQRCRAGDQHAMAIAKAIGEQARAGNPRAQISAFFIDEYTKSYPVLNDNYPYVEPPPPITAVPPVAHAA